MSDDKAKAKFSQFQIAAETLKQALDQWDEVSKDSDRPAPDDEKMREMRELLKSIQNKMNELDL